MVVVGIEIIERFVARYPECAQEVAELVRDLRATRFADPSALKNRYPSVKIIDGTTAVFKVRGKRYRLTATTAYKTQVLIVRALESHAKYDRRHLK